MLIPRCKNLNCIRKHKINVLIFFFLLPVFKNWLLIDLSVFFLLSNNGPSKGISQLQLLLPAREYITGFTSRHHLGNGRAALCSVQRRVGCFAEKLKRHCPSPKSSQSVVSGAAVPRWRQTDEGCCWLLSALTPQPWARRGSGVRAVRCTAPNCAPRPGMLLQDLCEDQWCRSGEHISQCLFCYRKEESLHCVKMFCIVEGASGHCSNITLITRSCIVLK